MFGPHWRHTRSSQCLEKIIVSLCRCSSAHSFTVLSNQTYVHPAQWSPFFRNACRELFFRQPYSHTTSQTNITQPYQTLRLMENFGPRLLWLSANRYVLSEILIHVLARKETTGGDCPSHLVIPNNLVSVTIGPAACLCGPLAN